MNDDLYKRLRIIPLALIVVSIFVIGVNLVNEYKNSSKFSEEYDEEALEFSGKEENVVFLIDINTASYEELRSIPEVGKVTADRIYEYRIDSGGFKDLEELMLIEGMTKKRYETIIQYLTIENIHE